MAGEMMTFPKTVDEFMEQYKIVDSDEVYTNGTELVPIFRMNQWFEHKDYADVVRCKHCKHYSDNLNDISGVCHLDIMARIRGPEDYCSKGVRKDNKKDI